MSKNQNSKTLPISELSKAEPREIARQLLLGFKHHDQRNREDAIAAFTNVDRFQFRHVDPETARRASVAYVDALWAKDAVENAHMENGEFDRAALDDADWSPVREAFERRAAAVEIDPAYAELSTVGWRRHKTGGDYWTPLMRAQVHELRTALRNPDYPEKPRYGQSGFGPEAARYALGVELHDLRLHQQAVQAMVPYFQRIDTGHDGGIQHRSNW